MSTAGSGSNSGFGSYFRLLRTPGASTLAFWGTVGRFPIAMRSISILLLVSTVSGSMGGAGVVAAAMVVAQGVIGPVLGRLADRLSQRRVLLAACVGHVVTITALLLTIVLHAPLVVQAAAAAAVGCTSVSFSSFMRARWAAFAGRDLLRTAYALESVLDETIFLLGPLLVTVLASTVHATAGLIACGVLTTTGSILVALHRRSEPAPASTDARPPRAIGAAGVRVLMLAYAGMGFLLGAVDITMVAFAREHGTPGLSGVFLSLTAVGSLVAGAVYGAVSWRLSQPLLLAVTAGVLTLGTIPLAFAGSALVMALLAVVAGIAIAPALITGSTLLESLAPKGSLAEGFSWLNSAGALGIALGTAAAGRLADAGGFAMAAWAAVGGGAAALALSIGGHRVLRGTPSRQAPELALE